MPDLFGIDIKGLIATHIGPGLVAVTLNKVSVGAYDVNDPAAGPAITRTPYACRAVQTSFEKSLVVDPLTRKIKGVITVILGTLPNGISPSPQDELVMIDPLGTLRTFVVAGEVFVDPAGGTAECFVTG